MDDAELERVERGVARVWGQVAQAALLAPLGDLSRLWDGVALWGALATIADMQREERERQVRAEAGHP